MQKTRYFVFCITFRLSHHLQNCVRLQIALVILHRMVYRNIDFSHVLPHFLIPVFLVNSASIIFGLNLRSVATQWCQFFMMPLDSPELGLQPQGVLYSGIQTSFDRKKRKTKKLKKLKNAENAIFCFLHNSAAFAPFAKLRPFSDCSRHSPSNGI